MSDGFEGGALTISFWGIILYPASDAPRFFKGTIAMVAVIVVLVLWLLLTWRVEIIVKKRFAAAIAREETETVDEYALENGKIVAGPGKDGLAPRLESVPRI